MKKSKDGRYHKYFRYEGKRYHLAAATERQLAAEYGKLLHQLETGTVLLNQDTTVGRWAEEWLETYKATGAMTSKSLSTYREKLEGYILPELGGMRLKDVTAVHLQKLLNRQAGRSFSHVSKLRMVLRGMFQKAVTARLIQFDPAQDLQLPACVKGSHRSINPAERAAIQQLAKDGSRAGLWALTMLGCGLRNGETRALTWADVDLQNNVLHIRHAMEGGSLTVKAPKTAAGVRDVPIRPELAARLRAAKRGKSPFGYVFTQTDGIHPHTERSLNGMWRSFKRLIDIQMAETILQKAASSSSQTEQIALLARLESDLPQSELLYRVSAGNTSCTYRGKVIIHGEPLALLDDLTPYCLRHTFCTDLQRAGIPLNIAKYLMGHSDIAMTANIYTHTTEDVVQQAAQQLAAFGGL